MGDLDNTLEAAGIDADTYCGILYGWAITRSGHTSVGRGDWLTKEAAKESLEREIMGLTASERSYVFECYVDSCEWKDGQGRGLESWPVDPETGCYTD